MSGRTNQKKKTTTSTHTRTRLVVARSSLSCVSLSMCSPSLSLPLARAFSPSPSPSPSMCVCGSLPLPLPLSLSLSHSLLVSLSLSFLPLPLHDVPFFFWFSGHLGLQTAPLANAVSTRTRIAVHYPSHTRMRTLTWHASGLMLFRAFCIAAQKNMNEMPTKLQAADQSPTPR